MASIQTIRQWEVLWADYRKALDARATRKSDRGLPKLNRAVWASTDRLVQWCIDNGENVPTCVVEAVAR